MQIEVPARAIVVAIKAGYRLLQPLRPLRLLTERKLPPALAKHAVHIAVQIALIRPQRWWIADDHQQPPAQRERLPDQSLHRGRLSPPAPFRCHEWRRKVPARARSARRQLRIPSRASASGNGPSRRESDGAIAPPVNARKCSTAPLIAEMDKPNRAADLGQPIQRVAPFPQQLRVGVGSVRRSR